MGPGARTLKRTPLDPNSRQGLNHPTDRVLAGNIGAEPIKTMTPPPEDIATKEPLFWKVIIGVVCFRSNQTPVH